MNKYTSLLLLICVCGYSQQPFFSPLEKNQTDLILEQSMNLPSQTQLSFGLIKNGEINYYGIKIEENKISTIDNYQSTFEIGSITKVFTATLLANFALDKKLCLDDKINTYIDIPLHNNLEFSFKQLANHTSGLPRLPSNLNLATENASNPYQYYTQQKLESYLANQLALINIPGKEFVYSNIGSGILGYVLSTIEHTDYESMLQHYILSKYKMQNTTTNRKEVKSGPIKGLDAYGNETPNWDLPGLVGAGAMLSTIEDLSKFAIAQFDENNEALALTRKKTFNINTISDYGLGWEIINRRSGHIWYKHNGGTGGYTSSIIIDTTEKNAVIILSNVSTYSSKSDIINNLSFNLMHTLND